MKITYDKNANAAYIYIESDAINVDHTYLCDPKEIDGMINLDFDKNGKLIGIEILGASNKLSKNFLEDAVQMQNY